MELDDFKAHWNNIQDKEFQQQKFSSEKLEQIIMNTTDTLNQLHTKSLFWKTLGTTTCKMLIGILAVAFLMTIVDAIHLHKLANIPMALAYMLIILLYCIVTIWAYNRQEQIFTIYNNGDVKASLKLTITTFKKFYLLLNIIYLFLYPVYSYAVIKLFIPYWHPSPQILYITCAIVTVVCLAGGHWYYKAKFFKKLKSLEGNLKELES
ncbi:hypothetical protein [Mucilaginibacter jinjuensis]|uniref:DUF3278 domain-containing protein n=1 Tax=Mucilaginibacter jinjuensis TaxID=1176721 RepID=A0ABY7T894_9SPHI|nr:hypothetical protein [Mucilaginibacter jinjuensis]WCT12463.1 hypothetical protein PQO05_00775 [Mucilaginibacter jinjuensis]